MKLTEAKLKQIILEALKTSSFRSFGVSTPDEKLRSDLGGEMFDKIQSLDPEQGEIMKQSFDPDYPMSVNQESLDEMLKDAGFTPYSVGKYTSAPTMHDKYNSRSWTRGKPFAMGSSEFKTTYSIFKPQMSDRIQNLLQDPSAPNKPEEPSDGTEILGYSIQMSKRVRYANRYLEVARGKIKIPSMFDLNLKTKEGLSQADSIILSREKQAIEEALEQFK